MGEVMDETSRERRGDDRRLAQVPFEGPDRRIADRRLPFGPPQTPPELAQLSDIDLYRAWLRKVRHPGDPDTVELQAEMARRQLDF